MTRTLLAVFMFVAFGPLAHGMYYDAETGKFYNMNRNYSPETGRYLESDPIGLDGGVNTYAYANNAPTKYVDPQGLRVTAMSRPINDWRASVIGARHAWFFLEPENIAQVQCMLRQRGIPAFAFPMWIGAYAGPTGNLMAAANAPSDDPTIRDPNRRSRVLLPPKTPQTCTECGAISADSQFIFDLFTGATSYGNNLPYNPIPSWGDGYNSNSFAQGLLNSTGYSGGLGVGNTVGSGKPVPSSNFGQ